VDITDSGKKVLISINVVIEEHIGYAPKIVSAFSDAFSIDYFNGFS
jgi:hypothetical protein